MPLLVIFKPEETMTDLDRRNLIGAACSTDPVRYLKALIGRGETKTWIATTSS